MLIMVEPAIQQTCECVWNNDKTDARCFEIAVIQYTCSIVWNNENKHVQFMENNNNITQMLTCEYLKQLHATPVTCNNEWFKPMELI